MNIRVVGAEDGLGKLLPSFEQKTSVIIILIRDNGHRFMYMGHLPC